MSIPDDITADLPPPGDDEPASLRRDIVDELADHLACAMARETQLDQIASQPLGGTAWSRVLARFGNPRTVALRLWRDAMQEKFTMQRWLAGGMIALAVVLSVGMALGFRVLRDQQQLLIAQQELTAEALRQLTARAEERPAPAEDVEWVPVEIRLEGETPGQGVPSGFLVHLAIREGASVPPWEATSDETGVVRFPKVHYGEYQLNILAPWGESLFRKVTVNPGTPVRLTVQCPQAATKPLVLKPEFVVPESLKSLPLWIDFPIGNTSRRVKGNVWSVNGGAVISYGGGSKGILGVDGRLRPMSRPGELDSFLAYEDGGDLVGVRWPDEEYRVEGSLTLWAEPNSKTLDGGEVLLRFQQGLSVPDEVRWEFDSEAGRLRIVLTEKGEKTAKAIWTKLDSTPADDIGAQDDIVTRYVALPAIPSKRP